MNVTKAEYIVRKKTIQVKLNAKKLTLMIKNK